MVNIRGEKIPNDKNILVGLTYAFGIGRSLSSKIIKQLNLDPLKKVRDIEHEQIKLINDKLSELNLLIGSELSEEIKKNKDEYIRLGTYKGIRMTRKPNPLPIRGQRTRHNARFWKGTRKVVANKKKAPGPK